MLLGQGTLYKPIFTFFPLSIQIDILDMYFLRNNTILDITALGKPSTNITQHQQKAWLTWKNTIIWNNNSPIQDPWVAYGKQHYCFTGLFVYFVGKLMLDKNTTYLLSLSTCELCGTSLDLKLRNFRQAFWTVDNLYSNWHLFSQTSNTVL